MRGASTTRALTVLGCILAAVACAEDAGKWDRLPSLPEALGVAAPFAGISGDALIVAGGANFPDRMPWEGGKKAWHDRIWVLAGAKSNAGFIDAGRLEHPRAYGVSVTTPQGVITVGGCDADRHYAETVLLRWENGKVTRKVYPSAPVPLAYASGALVNDAIYLAGGTDRPGEQAATNRVFALKLDPIGWSELPALPGKPRLLATAAASDGAFYVMGGVALEPGPDGKPRREYLRDVWRFRKETAWERLPDLPRPNAAAPTPAPVVHGRILLIAGDDGSRRDFQPVEKHPGFVPSIFAFDIAAQRWAEVGQTPAPRATVPCVPWSGSFIIPSGEVRPGVRSPEVWRFTPAP